MALCNTRKAGVVRSKFGLNGVTVNKVCGNMSENRLAHKYSTAQFTNVFAPLFHIVFASCLIYLLLSQLASDPKHLRDANPADLEQFQAEVTKQLELLDVLLRKVTPTEFNVEQRVSLHAAYVLVCLPGQLLVLRRAPAMHVWQGWTLTTITAIGVTPHSFHLFRAMQLSDLRFCVPRKLTSWDFAVALSGA